MTAACRTVSSISQKNLVSDRLGPRSKVVKLETHIRPVPSYSVDTNGKRIWTLRQFQLGQTNPIPQCVKSGLYGDNDYVIDQWSADYFVAGKKNLELIKGSLANAWKHATLKNILSTDFSTSKHLLNGASLSLASLANVEISNFVKGLGGAVYSVGKVTLHAQATIGYLCIGLGALLSGETRVLSKALSKALDSAKQVLIDLLSILTCIGHAIPSWLPLFLTFLFPHIGLAVLAGSLVLKLGSQFTGLSDLVGYGGTAILLKRKAVLAKETLENPKSSLQDRRNAKKILSEWNHLKSELNPRSSGEGAMLTAFGFHILFEAALMPVEIFLPGIRSLAIPFVGLGLTTLISDGIPGLVWASLLFNQKHSTKQN